MASKVKEKLQLLQKDEIIKCRELITNFKKVLNLWFMYGMIDNMILNEVLNSSMEIILHGLKNQSEKNSGINSLDYGISTFTLTEPSNANNNKNAKGDQNLYELHKIIDDFEWVRNAVSIKQNLNSTQTSTAFSIRGEKLESSAKQHCYTEKKIQKLSAQASLALQWLKRNLNEQNLCAFLQYLVNDKELLEEHYNEEAFLRQEKYVAVLTMALTAFETKQYGLLGQIETILKEDLKESKQHRRSNSQPNVILIPKQHKSNITILKQTNLITSHIQHYPLALKTIRKTQSLPEYLHEAINTNDITDGGIVKRPRCKTIGTITHRSNPQSIPLKISKPVNCNLKSCDPHVTSSPLGSFKYDNDQPTTSRASSNRSKSPLSSYTMNFNKSEASSLISSSASSYNCNNTTKSIQIINTDDIKIWTDHSWELKQKNKQLEATVTCAIPTPLSATAKPCKSVSPLNSFFSSLFNTPPPYTSWFVDYDSQIEHENTENAIESIIPDNSSFPNRSSFLSPQQQSPSLSLGSTVFDKFLPIDGKKVRSRKSQNLFDDVTPSLDCSGVNADLASTTSTPVSTSVNSKNCQSLTRFLQMSHLSRNNTDLEKENAHFRISEAIISAIEHIKWNKLETQKDKSCYQDTPLATDCLASPDTLQSSYVRTTSNDIIEGEHVPYAELEEVSYDLLSAEVVGLSLISKFDEKHLPKVSDLKWLVSDDDTPQKLLPMPDLSSSANPDEHVVRSATRGTRYWAPPRQQIIFTDHPPPKRKELLKQQNYRCAGCGMRVSSQHIQSFRYCTYLGKYHCTGCHRNQISATPAKILQSWDFKCYPVSVFAYRLLEQMYTYPLFYVPDLNPALYVRCNSLLTARYRRLKLKYVKDFIRMCRFALREQSYFESIPDYITADIDNWSMSDFIDAHTKCLHRSIDELINKCEDHIFNCVLCTARGFLCENCHENDVIYPWATRVERCDNCGTCFHRSCWKSMSGKCCRCQRIDKRHNEINDVIERNNSEDKY